MCSYWSEPLFKKIYAKWNKRNWRYNHTHKTTLQKHDALEKAIEEYEDLIRQKVERPTYIDQRNPRDLEHGYDNEILPDDYLPSMTKAIVDNRETIIIDYSKPHKKKPDNNSWNL